MARLEGKVALVTGAGQGIGQAVALKLASEGARLVINDLDGETANDTAARARAFGADVALCVGNVTRHDFADRFVGAALDTYGAIDIIVNNAGFVWDNVIQKVEDEQWQAIIDVHLTAPFRILRAAAPYFREAAKREREEGREVFRKVVNISSVSGIGGNAGQANYSSAKAGVIGLTRAMSKEWGRYRVNVNCVAFGLIATRLNQPLTNAEAHIDIEGREIAVGMHPEVLEIVKQLIPLGRFGRLEEAAGAVFLYCIPESDYITGETVLCAGGLHT